MSAIDTIPVTVEPEAAARIAELGFQEQVDRMIEHARQTLPMIRRIDVVMNYRYDDPSPDGVCIDVYSDHPFDPNGQLTTALARWSVESFPPDVLAHLHLSYYLS